MLCRESPRLDDGGRWGPSREDFLVIGRDGFRVSRGPLLPEETRFWRSLDYRSHQPLRQVLHLD